MSVVIPGTVGESLYWSYANLAMAFSSGRHGQATYQQIDFIVRNSNYYGLLRGTRRIGSFIIDEKAKIRRSDVCCYCDGESDLTLDHLIPQYKGGKHSADNLVVACRFCNSSKKALDLLEWMDKRDEFPPLFLLRRYLKLAIAYCVDHTLMHGVLEPREGACPRPPSLFDDFTADEASAYRSRVMPVLPFALELIPYTFPEPGELWGEIDSQSDEPVE
jgi:hypothetical protein